MPFLNASNWKEWILVPAFFCFFIVLISLIHWNVLEDETHVPRVFTLSFSLLISSFFLLKYLPVSFSLILNSKISFFFLMYLLISCVSLIDSLNIADGIFKAGKIFLWFAFFVLSGIVFSSSDKALDVFSKAIIVTVCVHGVLMVYEFFLFSVDLKSYVSLCRITSLMANKNLLSEYMVAALPFSVYGIMNYRKVWKASALAALIFSIVAIIFLQTRSAWAALLFCVMLFIFLLIILRKKNIIQTLNVFSLGYAASILCLILFVTGTLLFATETPVKDLMIKRARSAFSFNENGSVKGRLQLLKKTIQMAGDNPWLGVGLADWKIQYLEYGAFPSKKVFWVRPLNDYLLVLSEVGIIGFLFFILSFISVFSFLFRVIHGTKNRHDIIFSMTILLSLTAYTVTSFFSYPQERIEQNILVASLFACAVSLKNKNFIPDTKLISPLTIKISIILSGLVFMFIMLICGFRIKGEFYLQKALLAKENNDSEQIINNINKSENFFYRMDQTTTPLAWYRGVALFEMGDSTALNDFKEAFSLNPNHIHVLNNLGTALDHAGYHKEAIVYFNNALKISPTFTEATVNLAIVYINQKDYENATRVLNEVPHQRQSQIQYLRTIIKKATKVKPTVLNQGRIKKNEGTRKKKKKEKI